MTKMMIGLVVLSLAGCMPAELDEQRTAMVGGGGAALRLPDGTTLEVPPGALSQATEIGIRRSWDPANAESPVYELLPDGLVFAAPVIVTLAVPPGMARLGDGLRVMVAPAGTLAWAELQMEAVDASHLRASTLQAGVIALSTPRSCRGNGSCDDGNACTFNDRCVKGECLGTPYTCDDGNACTNNVCDGNGGCRFPANSAPCDDGNACTFSDHCANGRCGGTSYSCDDGNVCTDDACDGAGGCRFTTNTASCDDGNACTSGDRCSGGLCAGTRISCDDGNVCTDDSCDPLMGCRHVANTAPCDDGNSCTASDVCSGGVCRGTPAVCCASYELSCTNGVDDDCDGLVDRDDPDCQCLPEPETACSNGRDDDCDGLVDSADPDCQLLECTDGCPYGYGCFPDNYCHSHCENGAPDYDESAPDCGGADCLRCAAGRHCNSGFDCASGICVAAVCQ